MRRIAILAVFLLLFTAVQMGVDAAGTIKVFIDGKELITDQDPVLVNGRTLVPLRAIFEALDAKVMWNQSTKTAVATKGSMTVSLKVDSDIARINNTIFILDVPAQLINGRILVPTRFVSEALGADVRWDSKTQRVYVTTQQELQSATNVRASDIGDNGDGRDMRITFTKSADESNVSHYRVMVVKTNHARNFDLNTAQSISSSNYTIVYKTGKNSSIGLSSQTRDVDGAHIQDNISYKVFVLTVGNERAANKSVLSGASEAVVLVSTVYPATNVKVSDVSDYGDGRDLQVSFTKSRDEGEIAYYRILVVKTKDARNFDLAAANRISNKNSTVITKTGSNIRTVLSSSTRDTSGDLIENGVSYTVYVLAEGKHSEIQLNSLSTASSAITLNNNTKVTAPTNIKVNDVSDFGDGRDVQVSFTRSSDESKVSSYRIFVVKSGEASEFNLTEANRVSSGNYYTVAKTGSNMSIALPSTMKDTKGSIIRNGVAYKVLVMAVGNNAAGYQNALSSTSAAITLSSNAVSTAANVVAKDVNNYGDGRDLEISFTKSANEGNISQYRIMVVPSNVNNFSLAAANAVPASNYTIVAKKGADIRMTLSSTAMDVQGNTIAGGITYKVYILAVADGKNASINALSAPSGNITLSDPSVSAVTDINIADIGDSNDGSDLQISFRKANNESHISYYAVLVVKSGNAGNFNLEAANTVPASNYTTVAKTGSDITVTLSETAMDVNGDMIRNGVRYKVFVLSIANGSSATVNSLSAPSDEFELTVNLP